MLHYDELGHDTRTHISHALRLKGQLRQSRAASWIEPNVLPGVSWLIAPIFRSTKLKGPMCLTARF